MLEARLRTPQGQLALLALGFAASTATAVVMAANRPFFEKQVRERLADPTAETLRLAREIEAGTLPGERVAALSENEMNALYDAWVLGTTASPERLPRALASTAKGLMRERLGKTLAAGSREQRLRAVAFAKATSSKEFLPLLGTTLERIRPSDDAVLVSALEEAVAALERGG